MSFAAMFFVRNVITSFIQSYYIMGIILYNWLGKSFRLFDSSSYKRSKSSIALFQSRINSFLLNPFTTLVLNTYDFRPKRAALLYLV